jgi:hypothetical protein
MNIYTTYYKFKVAHFFHNNLLSNAAIALRINKSRQKNNAFAITFAAVNPEAHTFNYSPLKLI